MKSQRILIQEPSNLLLAAVAAAAAAGVNCA